MKNKEITIYELMGLIKDNKAPYEVIYQGTRYYIDELENYYRAEDKTPLFEHIFDNYNDYDALQEKVEILSEENDEWEDIQFEDYGMSWSTNTSEEIAEAFKDFSYGIIYNKQLIEKLIKNQKYLKEKLESKDE